MPSPPPPSSLYELADELDSLRQTRTHARMARLVATTAVVFATLGALFALAVVSFADCAGPSCGRERVVGVLGHAAAGLVLGALLGAAVALVRRWRRRA